MQEGAGVGLVVGHRYKVRLKPKEELVEVVGVDEHRFQECWLKNYIDGQVGVLHYYNVIDGAAYRVLWEDTFWYYRLEYLKVLGEVD